MVNTRNGNGDVPNFEAMINAALANALPNLSTGLRTQILNDIRNGVGSSGNAAAGGGNGLPTTISGWIREFNKLKPLAFKSAATSAEAEDWVTHMEKLFQVLGCPDSFKARLAAFKLEGDALSWWTAHIRTQVGGEAFAETCTWATFREIFYNRYFPVSEQQRFEREYGSIHQIEGENSVEYMQRFMRLVSFVGPVAGDAIRQARHYKWGLKRKTLNGLVNIEYTDVAQCCAAARNLELLDEEGTSNKRDRDGNRVQTRGSNNQEHSGRSNQIQQDRGQPDKRQDYRGHDSRTSSRSGGDRQSYQGNNNSNRQWRDQSTRSDQHSRHQSSSRQQEATLALPPPPTCATCGKTHPGPCYRATGGCYGCGSTTHRIRDCPNRNPTTPRNSNPSSSTGRAYPPPTERDSGTSSGFSLRL